MSRAANCAKVVLEVSGGGVRVWGGGVVTGHTVLHSACVEGSKLCAKVVLEVSRGVRGVCAIV